MKVLFEHDEQGTILSAGVSRVTSSHGATIRPEPGYYVSEMDVDEVKDEQDFKHLRELIDGFLVERTGQEVRLVRK